MHDDRLLKALPWAIFAPFIGGLGISHFLREEKEAARIRFLLTGLLVAMMIVILATVNPFSGPDPTPVIFAGLSIYAFVWLFDVVILTRDLARSSSAQRSRSLVASIAGGFVGVSWVAIWMTMWAMQGLPFGPLTAWLILAGSMAGIGVFMFVAGTQTKARNRRLGWRLCALWVGGQVGVLGAAAALDRDQDAALGWSLVGLPLASFVFFSGALAVRETGRVGAAFGLTAALYLLLWAWVAARTVVAANARVIPGGDPGAPHEPEPAAKKAESA